MHINRNTYLIPAFLLFIIFIAFSINSAAAHSGATGVVKKRMDLMGKIGKDMKAIKVMIQKKSPFDADKIMQHATSIHEASLHITTVFPKGSLGGKSEALPAIWENWDRFSSLAEQLTSSAEQLKLATRDANPKSIMKSFASVGKSCKSCHTDFRTNKNEN